MSRMKYRRFAVVLCGASLVAALTSGVSFERNLLTVSLSLSAVFGLLYCIARSMDTKAVFVVSAPLYAGIWLFGPASATWLALVPALLSLTRRNLHTAVNYSITHLCFYTAGLLCVTLQRLPALLAVLIVAVYTHLLNWALSTTALRIRYGSSEFPLKQSLCSMHQEACFALSGWAMASFLAQRMWAQATALVIFLAGVQFTISSLRRREQQLLRCSQQVSTLVASLEDERWPEVTSQSLPKRAAALVSAIVGYETAVCSDSQDNEQSRLVFVPPGGVGATDRLFLDIASELCCFALRLVSLRDRVTTRERELEALLDASESAVFVLGSDGNIRMANSQAALLIGTETERLTGMPYDMFRTHLKKRLNEPHKLRYLDESLSLRQGTILDNTVQIDGKTYKWYAAPVATEGFRVIGWVNVLTDVSHSVAAREKLREFYESAVQSLASAVDARDPYTHGHSERVSKLACTVAKELGLDAHAVETVRFAGMLHDIGKIAFPDHLLTRHGSLDAYEMAVVRSHPVRGSQITKLFPEVSEVILYHHERIDGKGYAKGLKGESIPLGAKIVSVADAFDAMTQDRPYRQNLGLDGANPRTALKSRHSIRSAGG